MQSYRICWMTGLRAQDIGMFFFCHDLWLIIWTLTEEQISEWNVFFFSQFHMRADSLTKRTLRRKVHSWGMIFSLICSHSILSDVNQTSQATSENFDLIWDIYMFLNILFFLCLCDFSFLYIFFFQSDSSSDSSSVDLRTLTEWTLSVFFLYLVSTWYCCWMVTRSNFVKIHIVKSSLL